MSKTTLFPHSKVKQIAFADPDLKDISKKGIDTLRMATEAFAQSLFSKCFDEAKKKKRTTSTIKDFLAAVEGDEALKAMLGQFIVEENEEPKYQRKDEEEETAEVPVENIENEPYIEEDEPEIPINQSPIQNVDEKSDQEEAEIASDLEDDDLI